MPDAHRPEYYRLNLQIHCESITGRVFWLTVLQWKRILECYVIITAPNVHSKYNFMTACSNVDMTLYQLLVLQEVIETSNKKLLCFIKLHATWPILCHYAEEMNMRAPLQVGPSCSM
jgi:hypothetical protein